MSDNAETAFNPFDTTPFYDGLARGRILLPVSTQTGDWLAPGTVSENGNLLSSVDWKPISGRGRVESFVIYRRAYKKELENQIPYAVALVRLEEGPRLIGRLDGGDVDSFRVGMEVTAEVSLKDPQPTAYFHINT